MLGNLAARKYNAFTMMSTPAERSPHFLLANFKTIEMNYRMKNDKPNYMKAYPLLLSIGTNKSIANYVI